jgi:tetratricopeptide (TPR) repeat protein
MSLSTIAGPVLPDRSHALLPASRPERFQRSDFIAAALVFFITLGVYIATLSPTVTLEDSGELITGAAQFGVPHPPGYPLWTMSGFLFSHLIPFGNVAWRVNLQSAFFGAAANAVLTLLVCHSGRWLLQRWTDAPVQPLARRFSFYAGMLAGLVLGFSDIMWGQGVIAEVYTLNGLFVNLVLLFFYFWILEPRKTHRLVIAVFIFALGLTNHHTLIQMIPAILLAAALVRAGKFWSVFLAVNLFSLSILVYLSWLSGDNELHHISEVMARLIFIETAVVSFFYLREFRWRGFVTGALLAAAFFAFGHYFLSGTESDTRRFGIAQASGMTETAHRAFPQGDKGAPSDQTIKPTSAKERLMTESPHFWQWGSYLHPGWMQITTGSGVLILLLGVVAVGLLFTSTLDRRMIIGVFAAGWVGLVPYGYESFASGTCPPMNLSVASTRDGFYYSVTRLQYPMSLPNLIKDTIGKATGAVRPNAVHDVGLENSNYGHRLWLTLYYYGDNLQDNFTVPLIFLTLVILLYLRRCDWRQMSWFLFLATAWFTLGFMLHLISPPEAFDFQNNLQYKVFNLQSHCIFVILLGYGALAAMTYLNEMIPEVTGRVGALGLGIPALCLSLLPLWSNFDDSNQAGHWFGYDFGADILRNMDRNAVYYGGSDFGRFVPTYMVFVESQQPDRWKRDPAFDRRDVTVITQNALCDSHYSQYIRQQYDPRFRPAPQQYTAFEKWLGRDKAYPQIPVVCLSQQEVSACWEEYRNRPDVAARIKSGETDRFGLRPGTNDIFEINAIAAQRIFEKNKQGHTFYLEQSVPMEWTYPYMLPDGLIFKLSPAKLAALPAAAIAADHQFWDVYSAKLLADPRFRIDDDATITFGKLAMNHADLYHWRKLPKDEEYFLKLSNRLSPQLQETVMRLNDLYLSQQRYDEALALMKQAELDDPRNEDYADLLDDVVRRQGWAAREKKLRDDLVKSPEDISLNLQLARLSQEEGKFPEVESRLRAAAALTNWTHNDMADVVQYYVNQAHNPSAAIAFLETRAKIEPTESKLVYSLAALEASIGRADDALKNLAQAARATDGTNALLSAAIDSRFAPIQQDPRFQAMIATVRTNVVPAAKPAASPRLKKHAAK